MTYRNTESPDWTWYLDVTIDNDTTVHINRWFGLANEADGHPKSSGWFRLIEDENAIVTHVRINGLDYRVTNPANAFSYGDQS